MTISCEKTGDLYLNSKSFRVKDPEKGNITFNVAGYTQGNGGDVTVKIGPDKRTYHVLPCTRGTIYGEEFWGEYSDHPKRAETLISFKYPD